MSSWLVNLVILAALPPAGMEEKWPNDVVYDGDLRDAAWLEAAYAKVAGRIVLANGKFWHLDEPQRQKKLDADYRNHRFGRVVRLLDREEVECELEGGGRAVALRRTSGELKVGSEVIISASRADAVHEGFAQWLAFEAEPRPITRAQFVEAIRAGLQLAFVGTCPACGGKGWIITTGILDPDVRVPHPMKRPCGQCKGKGQVPITSIKR